MPKARWIKVRWTLVNVSWARQAGPMIQCGVGDSAHQNATSGWLWCRGGICGEPECPATAACSVTTSLPSRPVALAPSVIIDAGASVDQPSHLLPFTIGNCFTWASHPEQPRAVLYTPFPPKDNSYLVTTEPFLRQLLLLVPASISGNDKPQPLIVPTSVLPTHPLLVSACYQFRHLLLLKTCRSPSSNRLNTSDHGR